MKTAMIGAIRRKDVRHGKHSNLTASVTNVSKNVIKGKQQKWEVSIEKTKSNMPLMDI